MEKGENFRKTFSILMTNFNNGQYIETAIKSVVSQTYSLWELVIVDDNSTDNSIEKIRPFLEYKRIRLIMHDTTNGYAASLKTAIENSKNEIIGILDSDDKLHEEALEIIAKAYNDNPDCGFIYSTMWDCDANLENCTINEDIGVINPPKTSIFQNRVSHFKTFTIKAYQETSGFVPEQMKAVDKDIIYKLEEVTKFKFVNIPLYYYRHHSGGISQVKNIKTAYVYSYIAKVKAYRRRLNKDIPNIGIDYLYFQYYLITFNRIIKKLIKQTSYHNEYIMIIVLISILLMMLNFIGSIFSFIKTPYFIISLLLLVIIYHLLSYEIRDRSYTDKVLIHKDLDTIKLEDLDHKPLVNIIIPAWKEGEEFEDLLLSITKLSYPNIKVIVNAGGNEKTINVANSYKNNPIFTIIFQEGGRSRAALGKIKALNQCLDYVREGVVYLIDADCYITDDLLLRMLYPITNKNENVVIGAGIKP
ncbi:MAG: glycosyltransferase, partial [Candidatus Lokiarchaeota archaeon]